MHVCPGDADHVSAALLSPLGISYFCHHTTTKAATDLVAEDVNARLTY